MELKIDVNEWSHGSVAVNGVDISGELIGFDLSVRVGESTHFTPHFVTGAAVDASVLAGIDRLRARFPRHETGIKTR